MSWSVAYRPFASPQTALSAFIASMSADSWAEMTPTPANQSTVFVATGSTGEILPYANKAAWHSQLAQIHIIAEDHGATSPEHVYYDEATNAWTHLAQTTFAGHAYDHIVYSPYTQKLYWRNYGDQGGTCHLYEWQGGTSWTSKANGSDMVYYDDITAGTAWVDAGWGGVGASGAFVNFESAFAGRLHSYDPQSSTWTKLIDGMGIAFPSGDSTYYHEEACFSRSLGILMCGGGNNYHDKLWTVDSSLTVTAMTAPPSGIQLGMQAGNLNVDPVSGKFLILSNGELWELNPAGSGTWTQKATPPAAVFDPKALESGMSCCLPDHGAVAYISTTSSTAKMHIYKPS